MCRACLTCFLALTALGLAAPLRAQPVRLPDGQVLQEIDFERHVHPLLDRQACNAGACHGSSSGRGGFVLSLFAESPERDYQALTRSSRGRLLHFGAPDDSLLLRRPLGLSGHAGGKRLDLGSWEYEVLRRWIAEGTPWQRDSGKIMGIEVEPAHIVFAGPKETRALKVFVRFADGSRHDMTPFCDFRHPGEKVIRVTRQGEVTSLGRGLDVVHAVYRGHITPVPVAVAQAPADRPEAPEVNAIDREVFARLRELHIVPAGLSSDTEFLRRVYIDTIGTLPTPDEIRRFVASKAPDKRARKIDELLTHPRHASLWATKWWTWTGLSSDGNPAFSHRTRGWRQLWHDWLRHRFEKNMPFDQLVEGIVCADSREGKTPEAWLREVEDLVKEATHGLGSAYAQRRTLDLFWRALDNHHQPSERIASAFLGIRLDCARCHKHPLGPWTPADHQAFADVFRQVHVGRSPEAGTLAQQELTRRQQELKVALSAKGLTPPATQALRDGHALDVWQAALKEVHLGERTPAEAHQAPARILRGLDLSAAKDPRRDFLRWLVARDNPYFARNIVNRTWAHYFGRGLVEPFDGFSDGNVPSHPRLLDELAQDFIAGGFDLRRLERAILMSRTYQLAFVRTSPESPDPALFARRQPGPQARRLVIDLICDATGHPLPLEKVAAGKRAIEVLDLHGLTGYVEDNDGWREREEALLRLFGRKELVDRCGYGRDLRSSYLHLINSQPIQDMIRNGKHVKAMTAWSKGVEEMMDEVVLSILSRWPTAEERTAFRKHLSDAGVRERARAIEDVYWALLNTSEFLSRR